MNRKILIFIWFITATSASTLLAQIRGKNFSIQIMAGHNDWSANSIAAVDGVIFNYAPTDKDLTFVSGLGVTWHPNRKIALSIIMESTNLTQRYLVYDEDGDVFAGEPLIKAITYNSQPRFFGMSASYEILTFKDFGLSLILGVDLLSTKLKSSDDYNFRDATPKLSDAINATPSAFNNSQFNLSYGMKLSYKRYFLRAIFKDDFNQSITQNVLFEGSEYPFQNYWKIAFIQFGATVFRF